MKTLLKRSSGNASAWTLPWTKRVICGSSSSMSTPACGRRGDAKRVLVQRFFRHELLLKDWRHAVSGAGDGGGGRERQDEVISGAVGWMESLGIDTYLIPEPMGTCVEMLWFWSQNPWEINSFLAFALSRVVGKG